MIKTANKNLNRKDVKFINMDSKELIFPDNYFDVITARHTAIFPNEIKRVLKQNGILIIEGIGKYDAWELKEKVGKGQCFDNEEAIEKIEFKMLQEFKFLENKMMILNEWYHSKEDFFALLYKTPIIENINEKDIEKINEYIEENTVDGNIKLVRRIYGFVCKNIK